MDNLTLTEGCVLGLVAFGERSGYELALLAERSIEHLWTPSRSQIYKTLPRLMKGGLVRRREVEQHGRPDKALYRITPEGRDGLRHWLDAVDDEPHAGRIVFPLKLFFCEFASAGTARAQLAAYRSFLTRRLERYDALEAGPRTIRSAYPDHVLQHGITRISATLAWIDRTEAALAGAAVPRTRSEKSPRRRRGS